MDDTEVGCCGFKIRFLLQDKKDNGKEPYLLVKEFKFPPTSHHLLVSTQVRQAAESNVITHEKQLSPTKVKLLHSFGKNRVRAELAKNVLIDQHGINLSRNLLNGVMQRGRNEAWGANERESLTIFYGAGWELKNYSAKFGVNGKFDTFSDNNTGQLLGWYEQCPLEVLNARVYGGDAVFIDTTHKATTYSFKTGPPSVIDCFGHTAPAGICQVREEEIDSMVDMLDALQLNAPGATLATDGGPAWPEVARVHRQHQIEDTWHNCENGDTKAAVLSNKKNKDRFKELKSKALYQVFSPEELLDDIFTEMRSLAGGNDILLNYVIRMDHGRKVRAATHTTKVFSCSEKGATSRCEQNMSRLKSAGTKKTEMRSWTLGELQNKHRRIVDGYEATIRKEIEDAITEKRYLSHYVLNWEAKERPHADGLEIVTTTENTPNPFHLMQSTKREIVTINMERPNDAASLGVTLQFHATEEKLGLNLEVISIAEGSSCRGSMLEVGMRIYAVNGQSFTSRDEGFRLIKSTAGQFSLLVEKPPAIGTVYEIQRKGKGDDQRMLRRVFIPDSNDLHCQSDYHAHTCGWIRCRYIQRALMEHKIRSMNDLDTIHTRWYINNSPMYNIVRSNLVALMKIDGLGPASLPEFLAPVASATAAAAKNGEDGDEGDEDSIEETRPKVQVPRSKAKRFNEANIVTRQITEMAKESEEVFKMVMPQLEQIYQNSLSMVKNKSKKADNARQQLAVSGAPNLPIVPDTVRKKKDKSDDINLANRKKAKKK